jgi:ABC-type branched-subunit amino acid transport system ATPase component
VLGDTSAEAAASAARRRQALLSIRDLTVAYAGAVQALRGVSLEVAEGAILAVLGSNGAGKTTLLRAISGTLGGQRGSVTGGTVELASRSLLGLDPARIARAGVVQVPEGRRIFSQLTVAENLRAGGLAARDKVARARARAWVHELFPILAERGGQRAGLLSGGEQQMLAIGRALMAGPRVLLLDEPSLGLAPRIVEQIGDVIREINREGVTVVLVEQNAAMALAVADDALVLEVGGVSLAGPALDLADSPQVRDRYLGVEGRATSPGPAAAPAERAGELVVERLTVRFGGITALSDVSFTVAPGSMHALIGPNGAGKSTCLNVLSGVYAASAGNVRYRGRELRGLRPHRIAALGVSRTFQNISLSPSATVLDNLLLARHRLMRAGFLADGLRLPRARRERVQHEARVREIAVLLDLERVIERPVHTLSYGTRKRVELARALCAEPGLLLLDEPVAGMTRDESTAMAAAIASARVELGISAVVVEHDMAFVMGIADRVTVLDFGRRIADGAPREVQDDPEVRRAYLGGKS